MFSDKNKKFIWESTVFFLISQACVRYYHSLKQSKQFNEDMGKNYNIDLVCLNYQASKAALKSFFHTFIYAVNSISKPAELISLINTISEGSTAAIGTFNDNYLGGMEKARVKTVNAILAGVIRESTSTWHDLILWESLAGAFYECGARFIVTEDSIQIYDSASGCTFIFLDIGKEEMILAKGNTSLFFEDSSLMYFVFEKVFPAALKGAGQEIHTAIDDLLSAVEEKMEHNLLHIH